MKNYLKRTTTFFLAILMLVSVPLQAFANVTYGSNKAEIINQENPPLKVAKPDKGKTASDLIKNPEQPAIYTLRTDYKVQRGEKYEVNYQPYIASVGAAATADDQKKVDKTIKLPALAGYDEPQDNFTINYDTIVNKAKEGTESKDANNGDRYSANQEFKYKARSNSIKIKHVFQDLEDFTKYTNPDGSLGDETALFTTQNGNTGSTMEVSPLDKNDPRVKGFVPEADHIIMQVPENAENFILEYRYNRAHYDVTFDTAGGTPLPARTLYTGQVIPKIADESIPTKVGGEFQGWKPSVDLNTKDGKTYKANEIIKVGTNEASKNLDANLIMPASKVTFTAVWKDNEKADYAIQFWAEKSDHADDASLLDKYDYIGTRVYKDKDTGMRPDLNNEPVKDIVFPDLDKARLNKIWNGETFNRRKNKLLDKFFVYNQALTHDQNKDPANVNLVKSVDSTGKTVYNIYYDRQVYDLYFTKSNAQPDKNTFYPEIWGYDEAQGEAVMKGGPGNLYHYKARFNEMMYKWPNDAKQTKGFTPGYQSFGWGPNYTVPNWPLHLDTPPYRLNADEFLDMANYTNWGGYTKKIDKGDGTTMDLDPLDFKTLSFGIKQDNPSIPHHMDFWMDGFKEGETIIRYDLVRTKADTGALGYGHRYPRVQGFTPYGYNPRSAWPAIAEGSEQDGRVDKERINDLNDERDEITPNTCGTYYNNYGTKLPIGQLDFIPVFFSDSDEFGDVKEGGQAFEENGYLRYKYKRNKYPLRFNYDPSKIKDDSEFNSTNQLDTFYEFPLKALSPDLEGNEEYKKENPKNLLDNPEKLQELGLKDLVFTDPKDGKLKVKRPDNLSDQMVFKGWALDPAGSKLVWENPKETMPFHPVNLYAKWGEPDYKWKVTFDPNGGSLRNIKEENLTISRKKIQEGDIGQEEINTYAKKEANEGDKQIFTVIQRQKLVEPKYKPTRKGYDFMGWEVIRYKKNAKGDYTDEIDTSYRDTYKVPELYSFGNDVVAPVYLKAIWVPNERVDVKVEHYMLDKDYKLVKILEDTLEAKRANYLVATTGDKQDDEYILAPHEELEKKLTGDLKTTYEEYNKRVKGDNTFFQQFRVEPAQILNTETNKLEDNPKVTDNIFKFFYIPFRQREYKVNYIDERFKGKTNEAEGAIVPQELVFNGNRHYDARNYRPIPGWVLAEGEKPQQQLFFDVNEKTNEFLGINGTGKDEITFYYKDVRVIEVPKDGKTPDGYVRVTFKAEKGGSFGKDKDGNDIIELNYDVIKGLKSDLLPVPKELAEGETVDKDKHYITPETGRKFVKWDKDPLLNKNTIINENHTFTAYFEWSGLTASGLVRTEAFKDPENKWTNNFAPKIEDLKKQLVWREKDQVKDLPAGAKIQLFDAEGNELTTDEQVYELVNEKKAADKDELVRTVNVKAKVTFKDGKEPQELTIPITVYKNVYEALTGTEKPLFLSQAEKGELKDITGEYVKVTVNPTGKPGEKDSKIYYVNPKAWVDIPEIKLTNEEKADLGFTNWTADQAKQNEKQEANGVYEFTKRHMFTEDTIISPGFAKDVVPQEGKDKPKVPDNFVKVIVKTTDNATDETKFEKTFWVNPTKEVAIPVTNPAGKTDQEVDIPNLGKKKVNYVFKEWQKIKTGEADDNLTEIKPAVKIDLAKNKYTDKVTVIKAVYNEKFAATPIVKPIKTEKLDTPEGKEITDEILKGKITPPSNKEIESITVVERPDPSKPGKQEAKVTIKYKDGSTQGTNDNPVVIPVEVHKNIIPEAPGGQRPKDAMDNYVKVIFKAGTGGSLSGDLVYYVSPEVEVDMTDSATKITKNPDVGYISGDWDTNETKKLKDTFKEQTEFTFSFTKTKDIVEKTDDNVKKPDGFVTVRFLTNKNGTLTGATTYYVNPKAGKKVTDIKAPTIKANDGYKVGKPEWKTEFADDSEIKEDRNYVANYDSLGKAEINYISMDTKMGTVSPASEELKDGVGVVGSKATAKPGYKFVKWIDTEGNTVSDKAKFVPSVKQSATYIAVFESGTIADKVRKSYDLEGIDLAVFVGDKLDNEFWKDGVSKKLKETSKLTDVEKEELKKALEEATVSDKSGRNTAYEVLSPSKGTLEIKFTDDSTLSVEQKLYVYDNGSQKPENQNQPTPIDKVDVTYKAGDGVENFADKVVMVKKGTLEKNLPGRPDAKSKEGYKDLKWTADPAIDETNGIQANTSLTAIAVTDHDFAKTSFTVKKVWADDVNPVPTMNFTLYRKVEGGTEEAVTSAEVKEITKTTTEATWDKLQKTDANGKTYTYVVKETFKDESSDVKNANWILGQMVTSNGENTITNKLKSVPGPGDTPNEDEHRMGKLTITKKIESKVIKPEPVMFRSATTPLEFTFKVTDPYGNVVKVDGKDTFTLKAGESKELNHLLYGEYTVEETDAKGLTPFVKVGNGDETESKSGKVTLTKDVKDATVTFTNKNVKPQENPNIIEVKASKVWVNGPSTDHGAVALKLYRQVGDGAKTEVTGVNAEVTRVVSGDPTFNYVWKYLPKINDEGKEYTYSVEEANTTTTQATATEESKTTVKVGDNTYVVSQESNTITNTYVVPQTDEDLIGKKVWSGVPEGTTTPTVKLELWRKTSANDPGVKVVDATALDTNDQVNFGKQDKTDANGNVYVYSVKELDAQGNAFNHPNYTSEVNGLNVKNTYHAPQVKCTVTYKPGSASASGLMNPVIVAENTNYTVLANGFTNPGYTFKGWMVDNGPKIIQPGDIIKVTANVTLTAQWGKITTPPTPGDQDKPDYPYYPEYPGRPIPMYPEVRYETIIQEKIVKVPVPVTDNYFKEVRYMQGFNGYFRPNDGLTRAEAAQILANALVEDGYKYNPNFKISYKDIGEAWYTRAVKIVTEANVFAGYDDGNFKPQAKITRNEWIATLKRFQELGDASGNNMNLSDGHWAKGEIQAAFNEGWLKIYTDGLATYKGDEFIPRQEVAAVSNKAFKRIVDKTYIGKNNLSLVTYKDVNTSMWAYEDILCASNTFLDRKDRYIAHWVKEDKNQFNIDTSDLKIVQKNFQRNPR